MKKLNNSQLTTKLTALWAVSESGLGGIFHAMKLPFSGLILGSFAVMIVTYIALGSEKKFRTIFQTTLIVILIKAIASPHSPFTAYVAVLFQGILGATLYSIFRVSKFTAIIYGIIALLESALQKLLMMILIFGENIWVAFQEFFHSLAKQFNLQSLEIIPMLFIGLYCGIYFVGGIFAGNFAIHLPEAIRKELESLQFQKIQNENFDEFQKKRKSNTRIFGFLFIIVFVVSVFIFSGAIHEAFYTLVRTFAAVAFLYYIINPLFRYLLNRWKNKQKIKKQNQLNTVLEFVPTFRNHAKKAKIIASCETSSIKKIKKFLLVWMALSLYEENSK